MCVVFFGEYANRICLQNFKLIFEPKGVFILLYRIAFLAATKIHPIWSEHLSDTLHFRDRLGLAWLRCRNRAKITVLIKHKPYPVAGMVLMPAQKLSGMWRRT